MEDLGYFSYDLSLEVNECGLGEAEDGVDMKLVLQYWR